MYYMYVYFVDSKYILCTEWCTESLVARSLSELGSNRLWDSCFIPGWGVAKELPSEKGGQEYQFLYQDAMVWSCNVGIAIINHPFLRFGKSQAWWNREQINTLVSDVSDRCLDVNIIFEHDLGISWIVDLAKHFTSPYVYIWKKMHGFWLWSRLCWSALWS